MFKAMAILLILIKLSFGNSNSDNGVWIVKDALSSPEKISKILSNVQELKSKKIFLQLRALGRVYYPTNLNIPKVEIDSVAFNSLLVEAKKNNIEVHLWLNYSYIWHSRIKPIRENHIFFKTSKAQILKIDKSIGAEGYFVHPNDKSNLTEIINIIKEITSKYKIDGVHLDYFRYPSGNEKFSLIGRTGFLIKNGMDPNKFISDPDAFIKNYTLSTYLNIQKEYGQFLRDELTNTLEKIKTELKFIDNSIELSIAVKPNPIAAKHQFFQDWEYWLKKDLCDFVVIMNYVQEEELFINYLNLIEKKIDISKVMVGLGSYNINKSALLKRINRIKNSNYKGYVLFSYNDLKNKNLFNLMVN